MNKKLIILFIFCSSITFGQFMQEGHFTAKKVDSIYKNAPEFTEVRNFDEDFKNKYTDKEFTYTEEEIEEEKKEDFSNNTAFVNGFLFFISNIFPYLLGSIIIFIILKTFLGSEMEFWNFKKPKKKVAAKLVYEDEDIHETDIEGLLQKAIIDKEYRLAVRYYYLSVLKELSHKKLIEYHKDKTNSEYLFEIEDQTTRTKFSYLSYVYSYIWYGDFPIDEANFKLAQEKYQSFKTTLK